MQNSKKKPASSNELHSVDEATGQKTDAHLHDEMLSGVAPEDDVKLRQAARTAAKAAYGWPDKKLNDLYGQDTEEPAMNRGGTPKKLASGGPGQFMENMVLHNASRNLHSEGMIRSAVPGRTDKLPMNVPAGSYVLPADIPSALGQGNSAAGGHILNKMFSSGPYGMAAPRGGGRPTMPHMMNMHPLSMKMPKSPTGFAEGGDTGETHVPIVAAGGEYIIHPTVVKDIGHGNITAGHKVLDKFVLQVRKDHIKTLKGLRPPKK